MIKFMLGYLEKTTEFSIKGKICIMKTDFILVLTTELESSPDLQHNPKRNSWKFNYDNFNT